MGDWVRGEKSVIYILISIAIFLLTVLIHIALANFFSNYLSKMKNTFLTYLFGFLVELFLTAYLLGSTTYDGRDVWFMPLALSGIAVYALLSIAYLIFFLSPFMGEESPTSKIFILLMKKHRISRKDILDHFNDKDLIDIRISRLEQTGWVERKGTHYFSSPAGAIIATFILFYRRLLGGEVFG